MPRYKITIEYDGTPFVGWQMQDNGASVQAAIIQAMTRLTGEETHVFGAGRTDTGVHALGQVAHFDLTKEWRTDKLRDGLNYHLKPDPIAILQVEQVDEEFDARFTAIRRHYLYRIINRRSPLTMDKNYVLLALKPLDVDAMHEAAQLLVGKHDFTTFRSVACQAKSPVKTIDEISVSRYGQEIEVTVSARSFLHHQVRSFVGCLKLVGEGKWRLHDMKQALDAKDRVACGPVVLPDGLYLTRVDYDEK